MTEHSLRTELPPLPPKMKNLPLDSRGFPIPWFVQVLPDGTRDFRIADYQKRAIAVKKKLCWVCGGRLGKFMSFVIGPMCTVTRTTSEPPCHLECAIFSATACPFLSKPRMKRNYQGLDDIGAIDPPGLMIERNPGATAVWTTMSYKTFNSGDGGWLIKIGDPKSIQWFSQGRAANRDEVRESIDSGYPILLKEAEKNGRNAVILLAKCMISVEALLPV